ncbi:MAG: class I SAM-dependent methyltransferase [Candidatus Kapabacteria bacterium]|nr:class I SAM-dependent methyltransferase [Candidatus Kapabacteria bacterium]
MTCPVCAATLRPHRIGAMPMFACDACTVMVRDPSLAPPAGDAYYEDAYSLTHTVRASTEMHRYFRYPEYQSLIATVLRHQPNASSWLDVGCDHGFFLDDVRRYIPRVAGVELSANARAYAQRIGLDVVRDSSELSGSFDVVSMWHVLEHIEAPKTMLRELARLMSADAVLAIRVPDIASTFARLLGSRWIWFQPQHHAVHYTQRALHTLLETSGFSVLHSVRQRPNTSLTRASYTLARRVMRHAHGTTTSLRDRLARTYQDITGQELFVIARRRG